MFNDKLNQEIKRLCENNPKTYPQIILSKKYHYLFDYIMENTKLLSLKEIELNIKYKLSTRINWVLHKRTEFPLCQTCHKPLYYHVYLKWFQEYPYFCINNSKCLNQSQSHKDHVADTLEKNYGVRVPAKSKTIQNKMSNTYFERTGYTNPAFNPEVINKIKKKNENNKEIRLQNTIDSNMKNYGVPWYVMTDEFKQKANLCSGVSKEEKELLSEIKKMTDKEIIVGSFKIIPPQELDIYIPELKLAFEFNGTYFHSIEFGQKGEFYHIEKTKKCEEKGIRLIHIWEDEWYHERESVLSFIKDVINENISYEGYGNEILELDRSKYCKLMIPKGYKLINETLPNIVLRDKRDKNKYKVADCGKLIYRKID